MHFVINSWKKYHVSNELYEQLHRLHLGLIWLNITSALDSGKMRWLYGVDTQGQIPFFAYSILLSIGENKHGKKGQPPLAAPRVGEVKDCANMVRQGLNQQPSDYSQRGLAH